MSFLLEVPPVCGKCYDRDPFCTCQGTAAVQEQPEDRIPQVGDAIEVRVGQSWLPARVHVGADYGPAQFGAAKYEEARIPGYFNFTLGDTDGWLTGAARVVGDDRWRWPERRP